MKNKYSSIIWDWNGTLLNDVEFSIDIANKLLKKRGLPLINDLEHYHSVFCFPITKYYANIGLDLEKESFSSIAHEYVEQYYNNCQNIPLQADAIAVLEKLAKIGKNQLILSATKKDILVRQVGYYNILNYFSELLGLDNIYAASKIDIAKEFASRANSQNTVIIGDTLHDKEVADALGIECILFSGGHNAKDRLKKTGCTVIDKLADVLNSIDF